MDRLRFAIIAILGLLAAPLFYLVFWFHPLGVGLLFFLLLPIVALVGVVRPSRVLDRRWLSWPVHLGGALSLLVVILAGGSLALAWQRPVSLEVSTVAPERVRIVFGVTDGHRPSRFRWTRHYAVPASGIAYSALASHGHLYNDRNRHPVEVTLRGPDGAERPAAARWVVGGAGLSAGCEVRYEEYLIRPGQEPIVEQPSHQGNWVDSLPAWGVTCDDGRLRRLRPGEEPNLPPATRVWQLNPDGSATGSGTFMGEPPDGAP